MRKPVSRVFITAIASLLLLPPSAPAAEQGPAWAYPVPPPNLKPAPDDGSPRRVPGSAVRYTLSQLRDLFQAPDWHPEDHPPMPAVVATGRKPEVLACGFCHRAEGTGGPENANIAGLPFAYIVQQMADYRSGARSTALSARLPQAYMMSLSRAVSDEEIREAATYFSSLKPKTNLRIVESRTAPRTRTGNWILVASRPPEREPIGLRVIELPDDLEQFESRDSRARFTAYVPPGSLKRGRALVTGQDSDRIPACATCHGKDLRGQGLVPSIAGRSPTYVYRQLHELKTGVRAGVGARLMQPTVANLSPGEMIAIAAYLGSLEP